MSSPSAPAPAATRPQSLIARDRRLSASYLGLGLVLLGAFLVVRGLASLGWSWTGGSWRWLSLLAWAIIVVAFVSAVVVARFGRGVLPAQISALVTAAGVIAVLADDAGFVLDGTPESFYPTAVIGFGGCLLACLAFQPLRRTVVGAVLLATVGVAGVALGAAVDPQSLATGVSNLLLALTPLAGGLALVHSFDRHVVGALHRGLSDDLVADPIVDREGGWASSEVRGLDRDAEELLALVAALPNVQPIAERTAGAAAELSVRLRRALLSDHEHSWLQIAVAGSAHLDHSVTVIDPSVLAAALAPEQRKDLLSVVWLCVGAASPIGTALEITITPTRFDDAATQPTIALAVSGAGQRAVDPAIWVLLTRLGRHTIRERSGGVLIVVEPSPADALRRRST
jgi:hypothetical protein